MKCMTADSNACSVGESDTGKQVLGAALGAHYPMGHRVLGVELVIGINLNHSSRPVSLSARP